MSRVLRAVRHLREAATKFTFCITVQSLKIKLGEPAVVVVDLTRGKRALAAPLPMTRVQCSPCWCSCLSPVLLPLAFGAIDPNLALIGASAAAVVAARSADATVKLLVMLPVSL